MNAAWHEKHPMPRPATRDQRIAWHLEHQKKCACRPIPTKLKAQMGPGADLIDSRFAPVVAAFAGDRRVAYGGKGFGSSALKVDGKIFAMIDSRGRLVVKLPRERVAELVRVGKGEFFDTGRGRVMKEWLSVDAAPRWWIALAKEARGFVGG